MDDWVRAAIKDADTEKKAKEIWEKAHGLDIIKPRMNEFRERARTYEAQLQEKMAREARLNELAEKDLNAFFKETKLSKEKIFQWTLDQLNYEQLPQDQRQAIEARQAAEERAQQLEQKYQHAEQMFQQQQVHARTVELNSVLAKPEVTTAAEAFDARGLVDADGNPVTFQSEVIRRGQLHYFTSGKDISAEQAVREVLALYGLQGQTQAPQAPAGAPQAPKPQGTAKPPVIPTVQGKATSPTDRAVRSLEDLDKIFNDKYGRKSS
jgi:hypothetical protein